MIPLLLGLATATTGTTSTTGTTVTIDDPALVAWSPLTAEIDAGEALFLEAIGVGCADLEVLDGLGGVAPSSCEVLGPTAGGEALVFRPDPTWPDALIELRFVGLPDALAAWVVIDDPVGADVVAVPGTRTVTDDGVSFRVCTDGLVIAASRGATPPAVPDIVLGPGEILAYFGASNGRWPEAAPEATDTFWFQAWDGAGVPGEVASDEVTLAAEGRVRTDLRLGFDELGETCPSPTAPWTLGDEVSQEGPPPGTPDEEEPDEGCGCATGSPATAWLWLLPLAVLRRYHSSTRR